MGLHLLYYLQPMLIFIISFNALVVNGEHSSLYPHPKDMLLESPQSSAVIICMKDWFALRCAACNHTMSCPWNISHGGQIY